MNTVFRRLTRPRLSLFIEIILGVLTGLVINTLSWKGSSELIFSGVIPVRSAMELMNATVAGAVAIQFFATFALTRWLWHDRQIEWPMFAFICSPLVLYFLSQVIRNPIETSLLILSITTCGVAIAGRTRFHKISRDLLSPRRWISTLREFWDEYRGRIGWIALCSVISTACFFLAWWIKHSIADQSCREPGWSFDCFNHTLMWITPGLFGFYMLLGILFTKFIADCEDR